VRVEIVESLAELPPQAWNALLPADASPRLDHGYLAALELSNSLARIQFQPRHVTLWTGTRLIAAAPTYLKQTDRYDQMADWGHEIAKRNDLPYHPTVVITIPVGREPSPRFLVAPDIDRSDAIARLIDGAKQLVSASEYPAIDVWSCTDHEARELEQLGFVTRYCSHLAWSNDGYASFDDFLARFRNDKRRSAIRRERRRVRDAGVTVRTLRGDEISPDVMDLLWRCHLRTIEKYQSTDDVLDPTFLAFAVQLWGHRLEAYVAERHGEPIASSFGAATDTRLVPVQWGALEDIPFVHFEVTWYHAIEEAIARQLPRIDAGVPTDHTLVRGFLPGLRHGATWIGDEDLLTATRALVHRERSVIDREVEAARALSPLRA
jgi:uncharacterized protein